MDYNLTEEQFAIISWLGEQIRSGKLSPAFRIRFSTNPFIKGPHIDGQIVKSDYKGNYHPSMHPMITRDALATLEGDRLLYYTISQRSAPKSRNKTVIYRCRFLERAAEIIGMEDTPAPLPVASLSPPDGSARVSLDQGLFRQLLSHYFSLDELKTLCFDVDIEYDNIPGEQTRDAFSRELILYAKRKGLILKLIVLAVTMRPKVDWSNILITA
jgi:hypothetical protein